MGELETILEVKRMLSEHPLFLVGLLLLFGYIVGKLAIIIRLPEITGFIVAGLLVNPYTTQIVSSDMNSQLYMLKEIAIGFLALTIGAEFSRNKIRRIGADVGVIASVSLVGTFIAVMFGCWVLNLFYDNVDFGHPYAILLAVIACATSPAVIVAEVHHLRARGKFVDYLFGVVALSDAITVILFGIAFTVVMNMLGDVGSYSIMQDSIREIVLALLIGGVGALPLGLALPRINGRHELMIIVIGYVLIVTGIALSLQLSSLLTNMALGATLVQFPGSRQRVFHSLEAFTPPIYALFFVLAGLQIDPRVFTSVGALGVGLGYIVLRGVAKYGSTWLGCWLRRMPTAVRNHLGTCMFSKGGVALGFVLLIRTSPAMDALSMNPEVMANLRTIVNVVLMSIFLNELLSPIFLRYAVARGCEESL